MICPPLNYNRYISTFGSCKGGKKYKFCSFVGRNERSIVLLLAFSLGVVLLAQFLLTNRAVARIKLNLSMVHLLYQKGYRLDPEGQQNKCDQHFRTTLELLSHLECSSQTTRFGIAVADFRGGHPSKSNLKIANGHICATLSTAETLRALIEAT